jgi:hypothetical protein
MGHSIPPIVILTSCSGFQSQVRSQQGTHKLGGNREEKCTRLEVKIFQFSFLSMKDGKWSLGQEMYPSSAQGQEADS